MRAILLASLPFAMLLAAVILRMIAIAHSENVASGWRRVLLTRIGHFLMVVSFLTMLVLAFLLIAYESSLAGVFGLIFLCIFLVLYLEAEIRFAGVQNRARQAEMLWVLALAVKSGRPLPDEIESYAAGSFGKRNRLLMEMADRLREGASLTEIVVPQGLLPNSAAMQIHAGITSQSLMESLSHTAQRVTEELAEDQESDFHGAGLAYPPALLTIASLIVGFIMYWIIPKFKKIFDDFGTELPDITIALINVSDLMSTHWFILGLPAMVYIPVGICCVAGIAQFHGWHVTLQSFFGRWFVRWYTPEVLRALSQSLSQGVPIIEALTPIIKYAGPLNLRKRLARAVDAMEDGADSWQAIQAAGLLTYEETVVLEVAQRSGNVPWVLESLARTIERRRMYRLKTIFELIQPMALIPMGIVIGFIAIAIFMPLIKLLNDLS